MDFQKTCQAKHKLLCGINQIYSAQLTMPNANNMSKCLNHIGTHYSRGNSASIRFVNHGVAHKNEVVNLILVFNKQLFYLPMRSSLVYLCRWLVFVFMVMNIDHNTCKTHTVSSFTIDAYPNKILC